MTTVKLPNWLLEHLPEKEIPHRLYYEDGKFIVSWQNEIRGTYDTIIEAYDSVPSDIDFSFDESINGQGGELMSGMFFCAVEDDKSSGRLLLALIDDERFTMLRDSLTSFYDLHQTYEKNPDDWVLAYQFLDSHPAFWVKARKDQDKTWDWSTENISAIWHHVSRQNGEVVVMMETGEHTPDMLHRYHDLRLDVYADSMESAYVKLAQKVHKFYNPDGTEIPDVEYEKSALELELEALTTDK